MNIGLEIHTGRCAVHVRVDDLKEKEAWQVRQCIALIAGINGRQGRSFIAGLLTALTSIIVHEAIAFVFKIPESHGFNTFFVFLAFAVTLGIVVGVVVRTGAMYRTAQDAQALFALMPASPRCEAFVRECMLADPRLTTLFHKFLAATPAATNASS